MMKQNVVYENNGNVNIDTFHIAVQTGLCQQLQYDSKRRNFQTSSAWISLFQ
jgi:hypothetical protein